MKNAKGIETDFTEPAVVDDVTVAFPGSVAHLMPAYEEIPKEFKDMNNSNRWLKLQSKWFYEGLKKEDIPAIKDGLNIRQALNHLAAIQGSFDPKHEHKMAAVAYLMSLWFV